MTPAICTSLSKSERVVDLRSDTFSQPSAAMYEAVNTAPLGDDMYGEDPTVETLERRVAALLGKPAAVLVSSASQGNLVALLSHCPRGSEVLVGASADLYTSEAGALSTLGGVMMQPLRDLDGSLDPDEVDRACRGDDIHHPVTRAVSIENTHQRSGGTPMLPATVEALASVCRRRRLALHVDGARLLNAAVALEVEPARLASGVDTITLCLSKGLSCPIGAVVCGDITTIAQARRWRKVLGGAMRQAGWIAAPALVALDEWRDWLRRDHDHARKLASALDRIAGLQCRAPLTNIVYVAVDPLCGSAELVASTLERIGVRCWGMSEHELRFVTYRSITMDDVTWTVNRVRDVIADLYRKEQP